MAIEDKLVRMSGTKAVYDLTKRDVRRLKDAMTDHPHSSNWLNMQEATNDVGFDTNGEPEVYEGRAISGYIPCKKGDTVYLSGIRSTGALIPVSGTGSGSILRLVTYTKNKTKIAKGNNNYPTWTNAYVIPDDDAAWVRVCYQTAAGTTTGGASLLSVMFTEPQSVADIKPYQDEYYEAVDATARADIAEARAELEQACDDLADDVGDLQGSVTSLQDSVTGLTGDVGTLSGSVTTLQGSVSGLTGDVGDLKSTLEKELSYVEDALVLHPHSANYFNPAEAVPNKDINSSGVVEDYIPQSGDSRCVSGLIKVPEGATTFYWNGITQAGTMLKTPGQAGATVVHLACYASDMSKIEVKNWANNYEFPANTAYIRFAYTYSNTIQNCTLLSVAFSEALTADDLVPYQDMYYEAADEAARADIAQVGEEISGIETDVENTNSRIDDANESLCAYPHSSNWLNWAEIVKDSEINWQTGAVQPYTPTGSNSPRIVSGWIPAKTGDKIWYGMITSIGTMMSLSSITLQRIAWYTSDEVFISSAAFPEQGYELPTPSNGKVIAYIRVVINMGSDMQSAKRLAILFSEPTSANDIDMYREAGRVGVRAVLPDASVDGWGDSLIAGGTGDGTSICDYIAGMMHIPSESHGVAGQGSGEIALRMGANEVHVTLENNQITSGNNNLTAVHVSRGDAVQNLMQCAQGNNGPTYGVPCTIAGVSGKFWNYYNTNDGGGAKFTPDENPGTPVPVAPMTKVLVPATKHYGYTVIWAGKNDFIRPSDAGLAENLADTVSAMAEHVHHNRFVILGVTASSTDAYKYGGTTRKVMDAYNTLMARRWPENFINIHDKLSAHGLELAGVTPTQDDEDALDEGLLPPSLMNEDGIHMNADGRLAIAKIIYAHMVAKEWV